MKNLALKLFKNKLFVALVINAVIMFFCVYAASFSYDSYRDFYNSLLICQYHIPYNNCVNYILASLVSNIQYLLTNFNCFVLFQILFSYLSFTSITYALTDKFGFPKGIAFSLLIDILFTMNHYADIASQKTAALLFAAGFLLIFNSIRRKRYRFMCLLGVLEIITGSFFCIEYFLVALAFAIVYFIADMIAKKKYKIKFRKFMWYFRPFLILYVLIIAFTFAAYFYSYSVNTSTQALKNSYEYCQLTDKISNFPYPDYSKNQEKFNSIGISEDEYELLKDGYYDEATSLNIDALRLVSQLQDGENNINVLTAFTDILSDAAENLAEFNSDAVLLLLAAALVVLYLLSHKKSHFLFPVLLLIIAMASSIFIRYYYNSNYYTLYGIWILLYSFLLYSIDFGAFRCRCKAVLNSLGKGSLFVSYAFILLLFMSYSLVYQAHLHNSYNPGDKPSALYTEVSRHPERYYVLDTKTAESYVKYTDNYIHPLWGFKSNYLVNVDSFGYKHRNNQLSKRGTDNIYKAVTSASRVYVIDNYITYKKENYFSKYYSVEENQSYSYVLSDEINGYKIYTVQ